MWFAWFVDVKVLWDLWSGAVCPAYIHACLCPSLGRHPQQERETFTYLLPEEEGPLRHVQGEREPPDERDSEADPHQPLDYHLC